MFVPKLKQEVFFLKKKTKKRDLKKAKSLAYNKERYGEIRVCDFFSQLMIESNKPTILILRQIVLTGLLLQTNLGNWAVLKQILTWGYFIT